MGIQHNELAIRYFRISLKNSLVNISYSFRKHKWRWNLLQHSDFPRETALVEPSAAKRVTPMCGR